jgi:hypothetical protein
MLQTRVSHPAESSAPFGDALVRELDPAGVLKGPAAQLTQTLAAALAKLRPAELSAFGVSRRERLAEDSDHVLRLSIDRVARILGAPECEVYVHGQQRLDVAVGLGEPPVLFVPHLVAGLPRSRLVFALAPALFCLRHDLAAVAALPAAELAVLLAGAVRRQHPHFAAGLAPEDDLDEASRAVSKAVPWLSRKRVDDAASVLVDAGATDLEDFCEQVTTIACKAALLLCDDLIGALELLQGARSQDTLVDPMARELLCLWSSETAVRYRQRIL